MTHSEKLPFLLECDIDQLQITAPGKQQILGILRWHHGNVTCF